MAGKKNRRECKQSIDAVKDLFVSDLLPLTRKLKYFNEHQFDTNGMPENLLIYFLFEDKLKRIYMRFISQLEEGSHDNLITVRRHRIKALHTLLTERPENEQQLLTIFVNKIGDHDKKTLEHGCSFVDSNAKTTPRNGNSPC